MMSQLREATAIPFVEITPTGQSALSNAKDIKTRIPMRVIAFQGFILKRKSVRIWNRANLLKILVLGVAGPNVAKNVLKERMNHHSRQEVEFALQTKKTVRGNWSKQHHARVFLNVQIKVNIPSLSKQSAYLIVVCAEGTPMYQYQGAISCNCVNLHIKVLSTTYFFSSYLS